MFHTLSTSSLIIVGALFGGIAGAIGGGTPLGFELFGYRLDKGGTCAPVTGLLSERRV